MWWVVTRYVTPKGQIIRHIYGNKNHEPFKSYSGAKNAADRMLEKAKEEYPPIEHGNLEAHAVKVVNWDLEG